MTRATVSILVWCAAVSALAVTAPDLGTRVSIDGNLEDFEAGEWVLDDSTAFRERPGDSRWGRDHDIRAVALTWDEYNLYIGVSAAVASGARLMLFIDTMCGGAADLVALDYFRRNIEFGALTPNFVLAQGPAGSEPLAGYLDCTRPFNLVETTRFRSAYTQDGLSGGALEIALPWGLLGDFTAGEEGVRLPARNAAIGLLAAVTAGEGTGAGDAAPDPSVVLENDSTRAAVLDNHIIVPLDADGDGLLDMGVSPREIVSWALPPETQDAVVRQALALRVPLEEKLFSPLRDPEARFPVVLETSGYDEPVFVTARVYASNGNSVRTLLMETPVDFSSGDASIAWDFRNDGGDLVPGGVYIIAVSGGAGKGTPKSTAKAAFAVVR